MPKLIHSIEYKCTTKQYYVEYYKRIKGSLCPYCNVWCSKYDKHFKTDEHMKNVCDTYGLTYFKVNS